MEDGKGTNAIEAVMAVVVEYPMFKCRCRMEMSGNARCK